MYGCSMYRWPTFNMYTAKEEKENDGRGVCSHSCTSAMAGEPSSKRLAITKHHSVARRDAVYEVTNNDNFCHLPIHFRV